MNDLSAMSLDVGYNTIKCCNPITGKFLAEPSAVVSDDNKLLQDGQANFTDKMTGHKFLVGEKALAIGQVQKDSIDSSYIETDAYRIQSLYALEKLSAGDLFLITGLPVEFFSKHRAKLEEQFMSWSTEKVRIKECVVVPQPMGTLIDVTRDWNGYVTLDINDKRIGIIDIGHGTIDGIESYENNIVREKYKGRSDGISRLHEEMLEYMNSAFKGQKYKLHEMDKFLRNNKFYYEGDEISLLSGKHANEINKLKKPMAKKVMELIHEIWPDGTKSLYRLVFTGGGAEVLKDELLAKFPKKQILFPEHPTMSNVYGYGKLALTLLKKRKVSSLTA